MKDSRPLGTRYQNNINVGASAEKTTGYQLPGQCTRQCGDDCFSFISLSNTLELPVVSTDINCDRDRDPIHFRIFGFSFFSARSSKENKID